MNQDRHTGKKPRSRILSLIALLALAVAIAAFAYQESFSGGEYVSIPTEDLPRYGSESQDSADGWVYVNAAAVTRLGTATSTTSMRGVGTLTTNEALYAVTDDLGNQLIMTADIESDELAREQLWGREDKLLQVPQKIVGKVYGKAGRVFKNYTGISTILSGHTEENVLSYYDPGKSWLSSGPRKYVVDEEGSRMRDILEKIGLAGLAAAVILFILSGKAKKKEKLAALEEKLMQYKSDHPWEY